MDYVVSYSLHSCHLSIWQADMVCMTHVIHKSCSNVSILSCTCMSSSLYLVLGQNCLPSDNQAAAL